MDHSKLLDAIAAELHELVNNDGEHSIEGRMKQNEKLAEAVHRHRRHMRFALGETVEPEAHTGEGVLIGMMGGTS